MQAHNHTHHMHRLNKLDCDMACTCEPMLAVHICMCTIDFMQILGSVKPNVRKGCVQCKQAKSRANYMLQAQSLPILQAVRFQMTAMQNPQGSRMLSSAASCQAASALALSSRAARCRLLWSTSKCLSQQISPPTFCTCTCGIACWNCQSN